HMEQGMHAFWIDQTTDIEYKSYCWWHSMYEAEGLHQYRQLALGCGFDAVANHIPQLVDIRGAGIESEIGLCGDGCQQLPVKGDGVGQHGAVVGKGVFAACLGKALEKDIVAGVQIDDSRFDAAFAQGVDARAEGCQFLVPR